VLCSELAHSSQGRSCLYSASLLLPQVATVQLYSSPAEETLHTVGMRHNDHMSMGIDRLAFCRWPHCSWRWSSSTARWRRRC